MGSKPKILIVEDEAGLAEILALNLGASGYDVITAADGFEALRKFEDEQPDLVTLDLNMPTITGFRLIRLFKNARPDIPVIAVTAYSFEEAEEVARAGADDFLTKPVDFADLAGRIARALSVRGV